jgi:serine O-acetyltransferase
MESSMVEWQTIRDEAIAAADNEPLLANLLDKLIIAQGDFAHALAAVLSAPRVFWHEGVSLTKVIEDVISQDASIAENAMEDIEAVFEKDPATIDHISPLLFYKGYQSLQLYRVAHWLWFTRRKLLASYIQSRASQLYGVDIHPAAQIGKRVLIDHATGLVVGETAVIEDNVSILHGVTLGGTGKETGRRHPAIRKNSLLGANATILGNIEVGEGAVIGAGSVVLTSIPPHMVAAGVPAEVKGDVRFAAPSEDMDQIFTHWMI